MKNLINTIKAANKNMTNSMVATQVAIIIANRTNTDFAIVLNAVVIEMGL